MNRRHFFELTVSGLVATWAVPVKEGKFARGVVGATISTGPTTNAARLIPPGAGCVLENTTDEPIEATILAHCGDILCNPIVAPREMFMLDLSFFSPSIFPLSIITKKNTVKMTAYGMA